MIQGFYEKKADFSWSNDEIEELSVEKCEKYLGIITKHRFVRDKKTAFFVVHHVRGCTE